MFHRKRSGIYISSRLQSIPWLEHGFASRHADGWPSNYGKVRQIHSNIVQVQDGRAPDAVGEPLPGDAVVTRTPGNWIGVRTADCVPMLLADTGKRAVAAVHAGWRGAVAGVVGAAVTKMGEVYGTDPDDLVAAVGPCIAECCFEVGPEVAQQFKPLLHFETVPSHIDLVEAVLRQLVASGVAPERIDVADLCTMCDEVEFHSFRRDAETSGRMVSAIRVAQPE
jgi:YfiH family protein